MTPERPSYTTRRPSSRANFPKPAQAAPEVYEARLDGKGELRRNVPGNFVLQFCSVLPRPRTSSGSGQATSRRSVLPVERLAPRGPPESRRSVLPSSRPTRREERDPNRSRPGGAKRHARQDKTTGHTSPMLKWNLTHIEVGISFLEAELDPY